MCLTAKLCEETKMPKVGTKNALFGYFWTRISRDHCMKSAPLNFSTCKIWQENKNGLILKLVEQILI